MVSNSYLVILYNNYSIRYDVQPMVGMKVINIPGEAGAVLQTPSSLINFLIDSLILVEISSEHHHSQFVKTGELKF